MQILIIKLRHLGDVLVTTPALSALKKAYPDSRVTMLVNQGTEDMVRGHPALFEVVTLEREPRKGVLREALYQRQLINLLRRRRFDLAIDFSAGDRGAVLAWLSGAKERIGYHPKKKKQWWWKQAFTRTIATRGIDRHVVDHHLDALRLLGLQPGKPPLGFYWSPEDENRLKGLLAARGFTSDRPFVVVHPTSRWMFKTWRLDGYAEVIAHLQRDLGLAVIVTGSPDRKERGAAGDIIGMSNSKPLDLSGQLTLKQLGCLISRARFFFGVDSAPMHIAAAVGTPVIALFGPSGDHMWGPWGEGHRVVKKDWECRPCGQDGCRGTKVSRCLVEITTDEVIAEIESLVKTLPDPAPGGQAALR